VKTRHWFGGRHPGRHWVILALLALSFLTGCATPNQDPALYTGAGLGAALGAGLGAAVNHRNPWKGAAIGGLLGGAAGGVAGEAYGRANPYPYQPQTQGYYQPPPQTQGYYQPPPYYGPPPG
jgi:hypothetical protein